MQFVSAGYFSGFATACEMPALAFLAGVFVLLLCWDVRRTLLLFLPMALLPIAAFFLTNYLERGLWLPAQSEFLNVWYQYEGSHFTPPPPGVEKTGIDFARTQESRGMYAFHILIGHHGLFSLTPIWLLALAGMIAGLWHMGQAWRQVFRREGGDFPWFVQPFGLALTIVVIAFYLATESRNYGGWTNGLRWLMWLAPIWLTCMIPVADRLATSKAGRWLCIILLAVSVFSVNFQAWVPWRHPWIYELMMQFGWKGY
jgi:hypothetical protein